MMHGEGEGEGAADRAVAANARGLPSAVCAAGVGLVELESVVLVPAHEQERAAKGTQTWAGVSIGPQHHTHLTSGLCVRLLEVAHRAHERLNGHRRLELEEVSAE